MAKFLGIHKTADLGAMTDEAAVEGFNKYKEAAINMGLTPIEAIYSLEKGFAYCVTEAESAEKVKEAHASVSMALEDVVEIKTVS
jgi:hypothetical protein